MNIHARLNFFYSCLSDEEKRVYMELVISLRKLKKSVKVRTIGNNIDFQLILFAIKEDLPELFYVNFSAVTIVMNGFSATLYFTFYYNDIDIYWLMRELAEIVAEISVTGNILQDEFNIHKFIVNNVNYSSNSISNDSFTIKGALIDKEAVCEGYSKAFKFLCDYANIPCIIVSGTALNNHGVHEKHSWNIVRINKDFFHVDSTWNRNTLENLNLSLYLNVSDSFISGNHIWQKEKYPKCIVKSKLESQIITVSDTAKLHTVLNDSIRNKQRHLLLSFNFEIDGTIGLMALVEQKLSTMNQLAIKSYQVSYVQELNCGVVLFDY